jgi:RNA polymerase sigma factor (sigma-70 family)
MVGTRNPEDSERVVSWAELVGLVEAARGGDQEAWDAIVARYAPLVWAICRRFALSRSDSDDVAQGVWLALVEHLAALREPAALPGWIATIARRECLRVLRSSRHNVDADPPVVRDLAAERDFENVDRDLERAWENAILREAMADLRPLCRELLIRLFREEKPSYRAVAHDLDMKVGSVGPTRQRCLEDLRRTPAFTALRDVGSRMGNGGSPDGIS